MGLPVRHGRKRTFGRISDADIVKYREGGRGGERRETAVVVVGVSSSRRRCSRSSRGGGEREGERDEGRKGGTEKDHLESANQSTCS